MTYLARWRFVALILLAFSLPFELDQPLLTLGPIALTNVEVVLALTMALTALSLIRQPRAIQWPDRYWLWLGLFCVGLIISAVLAPAHQLNAFKAALRLMTGILLALTTLQIVQSRRDSYLVVGALLVGGFAAAAIGLVETVMNVEFAWLSPFRTKVTKAGPFIRLTGPFDYANQAAMFIEATLLLLVAFVWQASQQPWPRARKIAILLGLILTLFVYLQASFLTFSRASFVTLLLVSLLLAILLIYRQSAPSRRQGLWWFGLAVLVLGGTGVNTWLNNGFRSRLEAGTEEEWYRTRFEMPTQLEIAANETILVPVSVSNMGTLIWRSQDSPPIILGARWVDTVTNQEYGQGRWPFPEPVLPGETVHMTIRVRAPNKPGTFELRWDVVQETVTWFGNKSGVTATTKVSVLPATQESAAAAALPTQPAWEYIDPIPERQVLWRVAGQLWWERPWLGIGFDNFRLIYGDRLNARLWNNTVHTNNWYLEMIVSLGLLGSIPFFLWLLGLNLDMLKHARRPERSMWQIALAAAVFTFMVHGLLDFFLLFNTTGLLFWLLVGLWVREKQEYARWLR
ncbi:MAG: O-antigen ligase family protein [Chloroflexi bacterium]|nr:O-antigen ligase family protein [Chloroflexota bacterium]